MSAIVGGRNGSTYDNVTWFEYVWFALKTLWAESFTIGDPVRAFNVLDKVLPINLSVYTHL